MVFPFSEEVAGVSADSCTGRLTLREGMRVSADSLCGGAHEFARSSTGSKGRHERSAARVQGVALMPGTLAQRRCGAKSSAANHGVLCATADGQRLPLAITSLDRSQQTLDVCTVAMRNG